MGWKLCIFLMGHRDDTNNQLITFLHLQLPLKDHLGSEVVLVDGAVQGVHFFSWQAERVFSSWESLLQMDSHRMKLRLE